MLIIMFNLVGLLCSPALCPHRQPRVCFRQVSRSQIDQTRILLQHNHQVILGLIQPEHTITPTSKFAQLVLDVVLPVR